MKESCIPTLLTLHLLKSGSPKSFTVVTPFPIIKTSRLEKHPSQDTS